MTGDNQILEHTYNYLTNYLVNVYIIY